jgi:hypothetical protein
VSITKSNATKSLKLIRPREAWENVLHCGKSKFYDLVNKGRIRLVYLGPKTAAVPEHELHALIEELIAERDAASLKRRSAA